LSNALGANHLGGSDTAAVGGDLAYLYGKNGTFAGLNLNAAQAVLGATGFGSQAQTIAQWFSGGAGDDSLYTGAVNGVLSGSGGEDTLAGGAGSDFLAGDEGDDAIDTGAGANVVAFNRGGGTDLVSSAFDAGNTLSFGGGIGYDNLSLSKNGADLIVNAGGDDNVVLKDWYAGKDNVVNLQVILDAMDAYDAASEDPLLNRRVQGFDFGGLVSAFDEAMAQTPGLTSWALTNALLANHLAASDDAAIGGDLAYWYGRNGGLAGMSIEAAQQVIGAPNFGSEAQQLHAFSGLQDGFYRLG
jgi:trimeric autotransporter adhesin